MQKIGRGALAAHFQEIYGSFGRWAVPAFSVRGFAIALLVVLGFGFPTESRAQPECNQNGACCDELNAFWEANVGNEKAIEMGEAHRSSKDFWYFDTTAYQWPEEIICPSIYSQLASGLKLLQEFSNSGHADIDYYRRAVEATSNNEYVILFADRDVFASVSHNGTMIQIAANHIHRLNSATIAGTLMHEVMHVENKNLKHVECLRGQNKGSDSCDATFIQNIGKYTNATSMEALFLHDLYTSEGFTDYKYRATQFLEAIFENKFNKLPEYGPDGVTPFREFYDIN